MSVLDAPAAVLVLEDGRTFCGSAYGARGETVGEAVFSTSMTGYQETLTDPSYRRQVVVMTAPHVGNTGVNDEDLESQRIWVAGYVVRDPSRMSSSWRSRRDLGAELQAAGVVGISGIDTRALTRHLRERGAMRVGISSVSGDADALLARVRATPSMTGLALAVRGLLNVQYALVADLLYVLEANPRASRTVPFASKATATPLAKAAARIMLGATVAQLRGEGMLPTTGDGADSAPRAPVAVKEAVMPFSRFRTLDGDSVDTVLGPEMRSTGEVMGLASTFGTAFAKSQLGAFGFLPVGGTVFVSVANRDKRHMIFPVKRLADLGFEILATSGTAEVLRRNAVPATTIKKLAERSSEADAAESNIVARILDGTIDLVINTPHGVTSGGSPRVDGWSIRTAAVTANIPCITTVQGLAAAVQGIEALQAGNIEVRSLQEWAREVRG